MIKRAYGRAGGSSNQGAMVNGRLRPEHVLYLRSMGKVLRVTAMFTDVAAANDHMTKTDDAVVAEFDGVIYLANRYDGGVPIPKGY